MTWYLIVMAVGAALMAIASGVWVAIGLVKELTRRSSSQKDVK